MVPDVAAFEASPNDVTFGAVHGDISLGALNAETEGRLINRVLAGNVPSRIVNALAADIVTVDFLGAIRYLRDVNVGAQVNPGKGGASIVRESARLSWLFLALRPYADKTPLVLTRMDLRSTDRYVGVAMNLKGADFSQSQFSGGVWRNSELNDTQFNGASSAGPLTCENCSWASARATLTLSGGRWVVP